MKLNKILIEFCLVVVLLCPITNGMNILVAKVGGTKSHNNFFEGIISGLLEKNNSITFISEHGLSEHANLNQIIVPGHMDKFLENAFDLSVKDMFTISFEMQTICVQYLGHPSVQKALQQKFELAIFSVFFTDCFLSIVHKQKIPYVYASPNALIAPYNHKVGQLNHLSVTPNKMLQFTYPISFAGRVINTLLDFVTDYIYSYTLRKQDRLCREANLCPDDMPQLMELDKNASLMLINSVRTLEIPVKHTVPAVIYAGGIHIKPTKPLPKDLLQWMNDSGEDGVIYFSLGTAVKSSQMKKEHLDIFLNVFGSLKQRVLWKFDLDSIDNLPSNVKLGKWLPQQDILAHTKTRVFITHGGLFSAQEATYFGVPLIGMPVFGDQINNVAEVEAEGWGLRLNWDQLTEERLKDMIHKALTDQNLRKISESRSKMMRDQPLSPSETVSYWIDYVLRHHGAPHLRSPFFGMAWYRVYNVDVWLLIALVVAIILIIFIKVLMVLFKLLCKRKRKTE